jgi:hypothetical protein
MTITSLPCSWVSAILEPRGVTYTRIYNNYAMIRNEDVSNYASTRAKLTSQLLSLQPYDVLGIMQSFLLVLKA